MTQSRPFFEQVQAHYDLSDEFFALFLDPSMMYSCAYFERDDMTLEEAQRAKIDLALGKCDLRPGMRLLDVGCGWGATARRAAEAYDVNVVGLTLSRNQQAHAVRSLASAGISESRIDYRLQGWEQFDEPVDRIVSIGAFEHFRKERYSEFFRRCREVLPPDGRMLLHTIVLTDWMELQRAGVAVTHEDVLFARFILDRIFPGGQLCAPPVIVQHAESAGFQVLRQHSLQLHYARTLDLWAANLRAAEEQAIALTSLEIVETYMKYLTGCARYFRSGHIDVVQFTCACVS